MDAVCTLPILLPHCLTAAAVSLSSSITSELNTYFLLLLELPICGATLDRIALADVRFGVGTAVESTTVVGSTAVESTVEGTTAVEFTVVGFTAVEGSTVTVVLDWAGSDGGLCLEW